MKLTTSNLVSFTHDIIKNKSLILKMLKYENDIFLSDTGQTFLRNFGYKTTSLEGSKSIQRHVLQRFGFLSSDDDLKIYRRIFHHYYNSPVDYDKDILKSVFYMRENRCLYYTSKPLYDGEIIPNINIFNLNGSDEISLHELINSKQYDKTIVAAFSLS